ncbi:chemotaxis protein [Marinobacterium iners]|uniref:CheR family methyltransferase n=1 Tax=Marinobacterium iners TaxID=48076 RepID=UPI001A8F8D54|nr:CheR family methyltransferase [Marinobacterium iners]QSR34616.1 chemotaxis protein [Marinobacterium iners]
MTAATTLTAEDHLRVAQYVQSTAGIQLPEHKRNLIEARLRKRLRATGQSSFTAYLDLALSDADNEAEREWLLDAITTNKTEFFREPEHFRFLSQYLQQALSSGHEAGVSRPLSVWSSACSTGEEPYTLAMVLSELKRDKPEFNFQIHATDIAPSVLSVARQAIYPVARIAPVDEPLRHRYLLKSRDPARQQVRIVPELRERVSFSRFNLVDGDYPRTPEYDVIFCRNVMIYFSNDDRQNIIERLRTSLRVGGLLFIGHSESIGHQRNGFETLYPTVYRRIS